jgi:hypothetical protein
MPEPVLEHRFVALLPACPSDHDARVDDAGRAAEGQRERHADVECHGALSSAAMSSTAQKWRMVGVPKAAISVEPLFTEESAIRVTTTNCRPVSAPADEPTMM